MTEIQLPRDDIDKVANQIGIEVDNPPSNTSSPSSDYSTSSSTSHNTATSVPSISGAKSNQRTRPYKGKDTPLEGYLYERGKLFRHLERRFEKYQTKANKEKDKFKKERQRSKVDPPKKVNNQKTPPRDNAQPVNQPVAAQQKQTSVVQAPIVDTKPQISTKKQQPDRQVENSNMIGSTSTAARSAVKRSVQTLTQTKPLTVLPTASSSSSFSTTAPTEKMKMGTRMNREAKRARDLAAGKLKPIKATYDPSHEMELAEATRVLRAIEIAHPSAAYSLVITTRDSKNKNKNRGTAPLRGRISLPTDPRRTADKILVFAQAGSTERRLAEAENVAHVGGEELFTQILEGGLIPDKVLCSTGMLPRVTSALARFLGPKGLMPTVRRGMVGEGEELVRLIREAKGGLDWRADEGGYVTSVIARTATPLPAVQENVKALLNAVRQTADAIEQSGKTSDDAITSKRKAAKKAPAILHVRLESTNGPSIPLNDVL